MLVVVTLFVFFSILVAGGLSGIIFWCAVFPLDVVKTRMQTDAILKSERKYNNMLHAMHHMYQHEGPSVFWRGFRVSRQREGIDLWKQIRAAHSDAYFFFRRALSERFPPTQQASLHLNFHDHLWISWTVFFRCSVPYTICIFNECTLVFSREFLIISYCTFILLHEKSILLFGWDDEKVWKQKSLNWYRCITLCLLYKTFGADCCINKLELVQRICFTQFELENVHLLAK